MRNVITLGIYFAANKSCVGFWTPFLLICWVCRETTFRIESLIELHWNFKKLQLFRSFQDIILYPLTIVFEIITILSCRSSIKYDKSGSYLPNSFNLLIHPHFLGTMYLISIPFSFVRIFRALLAERKRALKLADE
ncbi:uncharacterized protein MONOS_4775 [Monocercomonoides exilis]|uniref:uncharacterized protein n=1 Tax=Monocercomonoides exilis TaxID=2049356 RepID=UPI0035599B3A|nr:hypothetical protein MONOS_4775 [Monocercomonoides exilis]|eukprot:MONOS_4775.1-p1 / transcript=MONOS_4775.1 / gene=MONOS_4775 / organism=Monocercomonoides_exilis_PA203 / gene_product=unspecified product / transcript_product=unspecified product / location=Mono_scaffold00131:106768-107548(-) / protein_length=135 / sequence_SO=supercontig / SO=protein_coding / is_pseudo=false